MKYTLFKTKPVNFSLPASIPAFNAMTFSAITFNAIKWSKAALSHIVKVFAVLFIVFSLPANAQETNYIIDLPLYDTPYNTDFSAQNPSMTQALQFSKAFYQLSHTAIQEYWGEGTDANLISLIIFDTIATWLPLSNGWLHEEWHRAVMGQYGINSRNDIYKVSLFSETISVSNVGDQDLASFKKNHSSDFIRLHAAGLESQNQLNLSLEKDQFFENTQSFDTMLLWMNSINTTAYLNTCSTFESNEITKRILSKENTNVSKRDFTGLDCTAWVYDLFRPNEAYETRGIHPSGAGIDRYITHEKLNTAERKFLRKQYYLSFLNFVDPFLLTKRYFVYTPSDNADGSFIKSTILWNANIKHYLTPFGYTINLHGYFKTAEHNVMLVLNNHFNQGHYFPGIGADFINLPFMQVKLPLTNKKLPVISTVNVRFWQQPRQLSFTTASKFYGASLSTTFDVKWTHKLSTYLNIAHKTNGWMEGNVYLNSNTSIIVGLRFRA